MTFRKNMEGRSGLKFIILKIGQHLESLDPDIIVRDILKEYEIPTYDEQLSEANEIQNKYRL